MPTGSFKDRGQTVAITMAKWFGVKRVAIPTAGNAGGSMAAYAARAGMEAYVFMPEDAPEINQYEVVQAGGHAYLVNGLINDCAKIVLDGIGQPEVKQQLIANTDASVGRGVFGSPSYVYEGEVFWGQDRLDFLDRALAAI